ncbi:hypothetical protein L1987_57640 [Smallanthus sonchifolius]|uniref:Uncharacterized protein n=1 Tax=Smallanthus sonchifolius TaxID=185202 RepID=A0ACB9DDD2_9ASTR|nr:hypothetical protein L1987_57640 [Smallanthus sonchifolius]
MHGLKHKILNFFISSLLHVSTNSLIVGDHCVGNGREFLIQPNFQKRRKPADDADSIATDQVEVDLLL